MMLAISLIFQRFNDERTGFPVWIQYCGLVLCAAFFSLSLRLGKRLPSYVGLTGVAIHGLTTAYILGTVPVLVKATAILQEMPLMMMYLAWFYPKKVARVGYVLYVGGILLFASFGSGRYLSASGSAYEIVRLVLFLALCMELGFMWRGRVRAEGQVDLLTGSVSREGFGPRASKEVERARRHGYPISLALIDLDGFKEVNDTHGHDAGDRLLKAVVNEIKAKIRTSDELFRIGGDEFVLLLPHTSKSDADHILRRLSEGASHPWSWGAAEMGSRDTPESMLMRADANMYKFKRGGR